MNKTLVVFSFFVAFSLSSAIVSAQALDKISGDDAKEYFNLIKNPESFSSCLEHCQGIRFSITNPTNFDLSLSKISSKDEALTNYLKLGFVGNSTKVDIASVQLYEIGQQLVSEKVPQYGVVNMNVICSNLTANDSWKPVSGVPNKWACEPINASMDGTGLGQTCLNVFTSNQTAAVNNTCVLQTSGVIGETTVSRTVETKTPVSLSAVYSLSKKDTRVFELSFRKKPGTKGHLGNRTIDFLPVLKLSSTEIVPDFAWAFSEWQARKPYTITRGVLVNRTGQIWDIYDGIVVNTSGSTAIRDCYKEIRVTNSSDNEVEFNVTENNAPNCVLRVKAVDYRFSTSDNTTTYYVYYNNTAAADPKYNVSDTLSLRPTEGVWVQGTGICGEGGSDTFYNTTQTVQAGVNTYAGGGLRYSWMRFNLTTTKFGTPPVFNDGPAFSVKRATISINTSETVGNGGFALNGSTLHNAFACNGRNSCTGCVKSSLEPLFFPNTLNTDDTTIINPAANTNYTRTVTNFVAQRTNNATHKYLYPFMWNCTGGTCSSSSATTNLAQVQGDVSATDTYAVLNISVNASSWSYSVGAEEGQNTAPTIANISEPTDPQTYVLNKLYTFTVDVGDENGVADISHVYFTHNASGSNVTVEMTNFTSNTGTSRKYNITVANLKAGGFGYGFGVNDVALASANISSTLTVSKASQSITLAPATSSITHPATVNEACSTTNTDSSATARFYRNSVLVTPQSNFKNAAGTVQYSCDGLVTENFTQANSNSTLTVNAGAASVLISLNGTSGNSTYRAGAPINITVTSNVTDVVLNLTSNITSFTVQNTTSNGVISLSFTLPSIVDVFNITAYVSDTTNYTAASNSSFIAVYSRAYSLYGDNVVVGQNTSIAVNYTFNNSQRYNITIASINGSSDYNSTFVNSSAYIVDSFNLTNGVTLKHFNITGAIVSEVAGIVCPADYESYTGYCRKVTTLTDRIVYQYRSQINVADSIVSSYNVVDNITSARFTDYVSAAVDSVDLNDSSTNITSTLHSDRWQVTIGTGHSSGSLFAGNYMLDTDYHVPRAQDTTSESQSNGNNQATEFDVLSDTSDSSTIVRGNYTINKLSLFIDSFVPGTYYENAFKITSKANDTMNMTVSLACPIVSTFEGADKVEKADPACNWVSFKVGESFRTSYTFELKPGEEAVLTLATNLPLGIDNAKKDNVVNVKVTNNAGQSASFIYRINKYDPFWATVLYYADLQVGPKFNAPIFGATYLKFWQVLLAGIAIASASVMVLRRKK